jgi:hypothetical protein
MTYKEGTIVKTETGWVEYMDELHLGSQDNLPEDVLQNKGETPIIFFHSFRTYRTHVPCE